MHRVDFQCIENAIRFARGDGVFSLGDTLLERKDGWPMGGYLSSAATMVTLE